MTYLIGHVSSDLMKSISRIAEEYPGIVQQIQFEKGFRSQSCPRSEHVMIECEQVSFLEFFMGI